MWWHSEGAAGDRPDGDGSLQRTREPQCAPPPSTCRARKVGSATLPAPTVPTQCAANEFARGACGGVLITSMPSAANTASNTSVNFVCRSRSRNRSPAARWSRCMSRFRACCVTQTPVGWAVTPARWTWRVAIWTKNSTSVHELDHHPKVTVALQIRHGGGRAATHCPSATTGAGARASREQKESAGREMSVPRRRRLQRPAAARPEGAQCPRPSCTCWPGGCRAPNLVGPVPAAGAGPVHRHAAGRPEQRPQRIAEMIQLLEAGQKERPQ
jgi:hypothetical protein